MMAVAALLAATTTAMAQQAQQRYAGTKEAVEWTGKSPATIRKYADRGVLPLPMRDPVNGRRVWDRAELLEACRRLQPRRIGAPTA